MLQPAGVEKSLGVMSATYFKDPLDPAWKNDPGMAAYRDMMAKFLPSGDANDAAYLTGYGWAVMMHQALKQCGNDLTRANIMRQAAALKDLEVGVWLPGIKVNTSPTRHAPITQLQLVRFNGASIERFGDLIDAA